MKLLLDTCCIIWAVAQPESLSKRAAVLLEKEDSEIYISAISAAEIACAAIKGRVTIEQHWKKWFRYHIGFNGWQVEPIDLAIMEEAYSLPESFHQDPADRIITATARLKGYTLLTADKKLLAYPHVNAVW